MQSREKCLGLYLMSAFYMLVSTPAFAGVLMENPNAEEVYFLQQEYAHTAPDLSALAQTYTNVKIADEFHKPSLVNQVVAQLRQQEASVQGVTMITVDLNAEFSPYDAEYGEYDFDINDGTYIPYQAFDGLIQIDLLNGTDAQSWSLKPDLAQAVLDKSGGTRQVTLALKLQLENSPPGVEGQPLVLNARILSYDVLAQTSGMRLGHVDVNSGN